MKDCFEYSLNLAGDFLLKVLLVLLIANIIIMLNENNDLNNNYQRIIISGYILNGTLVNLDITQKIDNKDFVDLNSLNIFKNISYINVTIRTNNMEEYKK